MTWQLRTITGGGNFSRNFHFNYQIFQLLLSLGYIQAKAKTCCKHTQNVHSFINYIYCLHMIWYIVHISVFPILVLSNIGNPPVGFNDPKTTKGPTFYNCVVHFLCIKVVSTPTYLAYEQVYWIIYIIRAASQLLI